MRTKTLLSLALAVAADVACGQGMPLTLRDANTPTADDWAKAAPLLKSAIECKGPLTATPAVRAVFKATNDVLDGNHPLPEPLTVFDTLKTTGVSIFHGGSDEGSSYTVKPEGATLVQVAKAASLNKDGPRYVRKIRDGIIEASEPRRGEVQIACIRGGRAQ